MAAAPSRPGPVHYAFFAALFGMIIEGIPIYHYVQEHGKAKAEVGKLTDENQQKNQGLQRAVDEVQELKKLIGSKFDAVKGGTNNPQNQATVLGEAASDLQTYGKEAAAPSILETIRRLRESLDVVSADRDSKVAKIAELERTVLSLKGQYQTQVENYSSDTKSHEQIKRDTISDRDDKLRRKDREISEKTREIADLRAKNEDLDSAKKKIEAEKDLRISQLEKRIIYLGNKIDNIEKPSFEVAQGSITTVEHSNHTVLLNVGEDDFLKPRMTFSVCSRDNPGVARSIEDIKGKIEVIRIIGPHMAEAKIVDEDLFRPVVAQDLIYTPIWRPGAVEKISIVGEIDLDNDGRSDREQLRQILETAGCQIDNEVDDEGYRHPEDGTVSVQTRFLVKGNVPSILEANSVESRERAQRFGDVVKKMEGEAQVNGVRVLKLNDFLAYVGFHNKRRTYLAPQKGQKEKFDLQAGTPKAAGTVGAVDRTSNGNVSQIYKKGKIKQEVSNGVTSGSSSSGK